MRRWLPVLVIGLLTPPLGAVEPQLEIRLIKVKEVEVRSGPSPQYPATGTLSRNAQVFVRRKPPINGFVEIQPPRGSWSWVPKAVVTEIGMATRGGQAFYIAGDPRTDGTVPIHPGGPSLADGPLPVDPNYPGKCEVRRGTQGYIRGPAVKSSFDGKMWFPIDPLPNESRFIPASALEEPSKDDSARAERGGPTAGRLTSMPARDTTRLFREARQADDAGRIDEAIKLYQEVAREVSATNDSLANYCATRVYELRQRARRTPALTTSRGGDPQSSPGGSPGGDPPSPSPGTSAPSRTANNSGGLRSSGPGYLRRSGFMIDNRPTYALHNRSGQVAYFVTPEPGVNLEPYVERWVELQGIAEVRGDVRGADYMRVVKIYPAR